MTGIHDALGTLHTQADHLDYIARAFGITGNAEMAERLSHHAQLIREAAKDIAEIVSTEGRERFREAREASSNVFKAVLAGVAIATKDTSPELEKLLAPETLL